MKPYNLTTAATPATIPLKGICNHFDIVTAPYVDFNGNSDIGLFLIVYKESLDSSVPNPKNAIGLKITSKNTYSSRYKVLVTQASCPKLNTDSYIYINHPYTLSVNNCVHVCKLPAELYRQVALKLSMYISNLNSQLLSSITTKVQGRSDCNE